MAILGLSGMAINLPIVWFEKGFSKAMAISHLLPWSALVLWLGHELILGRIPFGPLFIAAVTVVVIDTVSLIFDYRETYLWFKGDRAVAGR